MLNCETTNKYIKTLKLKSCALRASVDADDERKSRLNFDEDYE